jgi:DNA-binding PadR family transcriptional regulator
MIDLAILGLLDEQDLHGYELKKRLSELVGSRSGVSFGSLYPALARLEKAGAVKAVEAHEVDDATIPMTGALSGELAAFRARISRPVKSRRTRKVYGKAELRRRLSERSRTTDDRTDTYRRSLREHDTLTLTHDLTWIDELIAATRVEADEPGEPQPNLTGGSTP